MHRNSDVEQRVRAILQKYIDQANTQIRRVLMQEYTPAPGTEWVRKWDVTVYIARSVEGGGYQWKAVRLQNTAGVGRFKNKIYPSLGAIATEITGEKELGPEWFGNFRPSESKH